jgi:hypothetical protein
MPGPEVVRPEMLSPAGNPQQSTVLACVEPEPARRGVAWTRSVRCAQNLPRPARLRSPARSETKRQPPGAPRAVRLGLFTLTGLLITVPREFCDARGGTVRRTIAYVDGLNLYHGIRNVTRRRYLWLDLEALCRQVLSNGEQLQRIRYFTARVRNNLLASSDRTRICRQSGPTAQPSRSRRADFSARPATVEPASRSGTPTRRRRQTSTLRSPSLRTRRGTTSIPPW